MAKWRQQWKFWAIGPSRDLWLYWLAGSGKARTVPFGWFDVEGIKRNGVLYKIMDSIRKTALGAKCDTVVWGSNSQKQPSGSNAWSPLVPMINAYQFWWDCTYAVKKHCDNGCCTSIEVWGKCIFYAQDTVEFWLEKSSDFDAPPYTIHDRLVRACFPGGAGFTVSAIETVKFGFTGDCDGNLDEGYLERI